jgi:rhodanese-related sulfurtransferase
MYGNEFDPTGHRLRCRFISTIDGVLIMLRILGWFCLFGSLWTGNVEAAGLTSLSIEGLYQQEAQGAVIVDIRTPEEWKSAGVIPGSKLVTFYDREGRYDLVAFQKSLSQIAPSPKTPVVLVCRSGHRSGEAGMMLASQWPDRQILHLDKGISEWIREGKPTAAP